jgi:Fe-S oxidoreductase
MATYKAEFRAHHYEGRLRPRAAYSMGWIHEWSRLASSAPWLANAVLQWPGLSAFAKWAGGIAPQRRIPSYAPQSFVQWFRQRGERKGGQTVMLWPDTFNNFFRAQTAIAATRALEALGYAVTIPDRILCCGRPLYDWGMLDRARKFWERTFAALMPAMKAGMPIIGLEPACVSAFRDELPRLFLGHEHAERLSRQTLFLTEFLDRHVPHERLGRTSGSALVQLHCHQHAVLSPGAEKHVLDQLGVEYQIMKSGCCGMAGSFGFERDKYDVSIAAAERAMLPLIRNAGADAVILANGFSCREQIEQCTGRKTMHIADLPANALGAVA